MSALLPDDLLLPDDPVAPVDDPDTLPPVVFAPARSGRAADPREDGVIVP